jgi:tetratricopeptide (TPR) repeat protein
MAIRGSLTEASISDVLQLLALGMKSGCLSVTRNGSFASVCFDRGRISHAEIVNRRDRLADLLVKTGAVPADVMARTLELPGTAESDAVLAQRLLDDGAVAPDALERVVRGRVEEAVYHLFTWNQGSFSFEADLRPADSEITVSINPESLLLEGARRVDEWSQIEKKIPSLDLVFALDTARVAQSDARLTGEQQRLVPLIDGHADVSRLVEQTAMSEFDVGKALYGLLAAGFLHRVGRSQPKTPNAPETRIAEHRNLGVAFYRTGMLDESMREFRRVLELREHDPAARFHVALILLRQGQWSDAAAALAAVAEQPSAAPAVFHNLAIALEQQGRHDEAAAAFDEAVRRGGGDDARIRTGQGALALQRGNVAGADALLAEARTLSGSRTPGVAWFHYASLAAALSGDLARAVTILQDGVEAYPSAAALRNNLAAALERRGDYDRAAAEVERAVLDDAALPQPHKNMGDFLYRAGRYDEAFDAYHRAIRLDPALGEDVYLKIGNIRYRRRETDEAVRCWERALELEPTNAIVRANLDVVRVSR